MGQPGITRRMGEGLSLVDAPRGTGTFQSAVRLILDGTTAK